MAGTPGHVSDKVREQIEWHKNRMYNMPLSRMEPAYYGPADVAARQEHEMAQRMERERLIGGPPQGYEQGPSSPRPRPGMIPAGGPPSHGTRSPHDVGEIHVHRNGIPADVAIYDQVDGHEVKPSLGPAGYGYYLDSDYGPDIIDYYPLTAPQSQGGRERARYEARMRPSDKGPPDMPLMPPDSASRDESGPSHRTPAFGFPPPPRRPTPPGPDDFDPAWLDWYSETVNMNTFNLTYLGATLILNKRVKPLLGYLKQMPGPRAEKYRAVLEEIKGRCDEVIAKG